MLAKVHADNRFNLRVPVVSGDNTTEVKARDYSGNETTETYTFNVDGVSRTFLYDDNGNLEDDGTRTYEWDAEDRLVAVKEGTTTLASFVYNAFGQRFQRTVGGVITTYVVGALIVERDGTARRMESIDVLGLRGSSLTSKVLSLLHGDKEIRVHFGEPQSLDLSEFKELVVRFLGYDSELPDPLFGLERSLNEVAADVRRASSYEDVFDQIGVPRPEDALDVL